MENMDNNIEDFFKKQLNRFDEPFEDWEKPNAGDWDMIASEVPMFNKSSFGTWVNISIVGLSTVLLVSLMYVWILKKDIIRLEKTVQIQKEQINRVEQNRQIVETKHIEQQTIIEKENETLKRQNQEVNQNNKILNQVRKQQEGIITNFSNALALGKIKELEEQKNTGNPNLTQSKQVVSIVSTIPISKTDDKDFNQTEINGEIVTKEQLAEHKNKSIAEMQNKILNNQVSIVEQEQNEVVPTEIFKLPIKDVQTYNQNPKIFEEKIYISSNDNKLKKQKNPLIILPKIDFNNVELGYEYRLQALEISSDLNIKELETDDKKHSNQESFLNLHGLTLSIPLSEKWSIQPGLRFSNSTLSFKKEASSIYSTMDEYTLPNGSISKNLNIEQETPFAKTNTSIQFVFDENDKLIQDEEFSWSVFGEQKQQSFQIPLGVNYQFGGEKWNWFLGSGLQWNLMDIERVDYEIVFEDREKKFNVFSSDTEILSDIEKLDYFSIYGNAGLEYQLTNNWSIRGTLGYNYHFLNNKTIENWENRDRSIAINLEYMF